MSNHLAPFHFDIVGSFLRPAELKEARQAFTDGKISREDLTLQTLSKSKKQQVYL